MNIAGLATAVPPRSIRQSAAADLAAPLVGAADGGRLVQALYRRAGVSQRHSVLLEHGEEELQQSFYAPPVDDSDGGPTTSGRMQRFASEALALAAGACRAALADAQLEAPAVTHLVTVSCTGFDAPGLDVRLIPELGLSAGTRCTHVGFMGCHGMFNALQVARGLVAAEPGATVLVVAAELCSLHFQYSMESDALVANSLFADGAAAAVCTASATPGGMRVDSPSRRLFPRSESAMTWRVADNGFRMTLSPSVPGLIREHLRSWIDDWLAAEGLARGDIEMWAVHPGGPRILRAAQDALQLEPDALEVSRSVLSRYGNMSSPTIGFILAGLRRRGLEGRGVAIGFGPGLVGEAFLFEASRGVPA